MRWLPFLSLKSQPAFDYWKDEKRKPYLLAVLNAQVGALGVGLGGGIARKDAFDRWRAAQIVAAYAAAAAKSLIQFFSKEEIAIVWEQFKPSIACVQSSSAMAMQAKPHSSAPCTANP